MRFKLSTLCRQLETAAGKRLRQFVFPSVGLDLLYPFAAAIADEADDALQGEFHRQEEIDPPGAEVPDEARQGPQGQGNEPDAAGIRQEQKAGVAPAPQDALGNDEGHHLHGQHEIGDLQHLPGDGLRLRLDGVKAHIGPREGQEDGDDRQAEEEGQEDIGVALALGLGQVPFPDGVADHDRAGPGKAAVEDGDEAHQAAGNGIGGADLRGDVTVDHAYQSKAQTQQGIAEQHRQAEFHILPPKLPAGAEEMPEPEAEGVLLHGEVAEDEEELENPGNDGAHGSPQQLQPGGAQLAENEDPVEKEVQEKGDGGADQGDAHLPHAAHEIGGGGAEAGEEEGGPDEAHIGPAPEDDRFVAGEGPEQQPGPDHPQQGEYEADRRRHPQGHGRRSEHGFPLFPAPELAGHDHRAAAQAHADELEKGIGLVGEGRRSDADLPEGADHDIVQKVDAHGDELLEDHRQHEQQRLFIESPVPQYEHRFALRWDAFAPL